MYSSILGFFFLMANKSNEVPIIYSRGIHLSPFRKRRQLVIQAGYTPMIKDGRKLGTSRLENATPLAQNFNLRQDLLVAVPNEEYIVRR
jgi:hypothetical protein